MKTKILLLLLILTTINANTILNTTQVTDLSSFGGNLHRFIPRTDHLFCSYTADWGFSGPADSFRIFRQESFLDEFVQTSSFTPELSMKNSFVTVNDMTYFLTEAEDFSAMSSRNVTLWAMDSSGTVTDIHTSFYVVYDQTDILVADDVLFFATVDFDFEVTLIQCDLSLAVASCVDILIPDIRSSADIVGFFDGILIMDTRDLSFDRVHWFYNLLDETSEFGEHLGTELMSWYISSSGDLIWNDPESLKLSITSISDPSTTLMFNISEFTDAYYYDAGDIMYFLHEGNISKIDLATGVMSTVHTETAETSNFVEGNPEREGFLYYTIAQTDSAELKRMSLTDETISSVLSISDLAISFEIEAVTNDQSDLIMIYDRNSDVPTVYLSDLEGNNFEFNLAGFVIHWVLFESKLTLHEMFTDSIIQVEVSPMQETTIMQDTTIMEDTTTQQTSMTEDTTTKEVTETGEDTNTETDQTSEDETTSMETDEETDIETDEASEDENSDLDTEDENSDLDTEDSAEDDDDAGAFAIQMLGVTLLVVFF